jgi:hypothetical protein
MRCGSDCSHVVGQKPRIPGTNGCGGACDGSWARARPPWGPAGRPLPCEALASVLCVLYTSPPHPVPWVGAFSLSASTLCCWLLGSARFSSLPKPP